MQLFTKVQFSNEVFSSHDMNLWWTFHRQTEISLTMYKSIYFYNDSDMAWIYQWGIHKIVYELTTSLNLEEQWHFDSVIIYTLVRTSEMGSQRQSTHQFGANVQINQLSFLRGAVKFLYGLVITFAVLLAVITLHR